MILGGATASADAPRRVPVLQTRTGKPPVAKKPTAPTATALMVSYQRIGRELMRLQSFRGTDCTLDLWPTFRSIKLDTALATPESRTQTAATLSEIATRIERKRGITLRQECLTNPLASECS